MSQSRGIDTQPSIGCIWRKRLGIKLGVFFQYVPREIRSSALNEAGAGALPTISIVTPSYNQGAYIHATVQSVVTQRYPNLQYVIQDAGSTDSTLSVLKGFPSDLFELAVEADTGQANALNRGFAKCTGEILAYLNSDDILLENTLKTVGAFFRDNPSVDVVYGNRLIIDADGQEVGRWVLPGHDGILLRRIDYIPQETLFWRRRIWERAGSYLDENLEFALDWDLLLRFEENEAVFVHLPQMLGAFRVHAAQKTTESYRSIGKKEMKSIRRKYGKGCSGLQLMLRHLSFLIKHLIADRHFGD